MKKSFILNDRTPMPATGRPLFRFVRKPLLILAAILATTVPLRLSAATLFWDGDGAGVVGGGVGTWNTAGLNWSTTAGGSTYQAWVNANNDDAVFGGTAGAQVVTLGAPITANSLTFTVSGYTISGAAANVLNSATGTLTVDTQIAAASTAIVNVFYAPTLATIVKNGTGLFSSGTSQTAFAGKWVVNAGILSVAGDTRLGVVPGAVVPDQVTLNGGFLRSSTAGVVFTANRGITLGALGGGFDSTTAAQTWSGPITGSAGGSLIKNGTVSLTLNNNANSYDGTTLINTGKLSVGAANALGSAAAGTEVASGAEVLFDGAAINFTINEPFRIAGIGGADGGAIAVIASAAPTLSGPITLTGDATITVSSSASATFNNPAAFTSLANQNLTLAGGSNPTGVKLISGVIALGSGGLTKTQGGLWTLAGANTYSGTTTISAGTLQLGTGLAGGDGTISNSLSIVNSASLVFNRFGSTGYSGVISGTGSVTKTGPGKETLYGPNTYTGLTRISAGILSVASIGNGGVASGNMGSASNAAANLILDGGTLQYTGATDSTDRSFTINTGKTAIIDIVGNELTISGAVAATDGALIKVGAGTLILAGDNAYTGQTEIDLGVLRLGTSERISDLSNLLLNGGTFESAGFNETLGTLDNDASSVLDFGAGTSALTFADSDAQTWAGTLSILNWTPGLDTFRVGIDAVGFDAQLAQIQFADYGNAPGQIDGNGYITPLVIPEPNSALLFGLGGIAMLARLRRRA